MNVIGKYLASLHRRKIPLTKCGMIFLSRGRRICATCPFPACPTTAHARTVWRPRQGRRCARRDYINETFSHSGFRASNSLRPGERRAPVIELRQCRVALWCRTSHLTLSGVTFPHFKVKRPQFALLVVCDDAAESITVLCLARTQQSMFKTGTRNVSLLDCFAVFYHVPT